MSKKRSNILILFLVLLGSSGISFLFNTSINEINDTPTNIIDGEDTINPTTSDLLNMIVMDGIINNAEWVNATHVAKFYLSVNNTDNPPNLDGYNYMYIGDDADNLYIGLDLCSDQTGEIADEWISLFLNTNGSTFNGDIQWHDALNNGAESLIHQVDKNQTWNPFFTNNIGSSTSHNYRDANFSIDIGSYEGNVNDDTWYPDSDTFNLTSAQNGTDYITWANFEFNMSEVFSLFSETFLEAVSHCQMTFRTWNNDSVDFQKVIFWYNNGTLK